MKRNLIHLARIVDPDGVSRAETDLKKAILISNNTLDDPLEPSHAPFEPSHAPFEHSHAPFEPSHAPLEPSDKVSSSQRGYQLGEYSLKGINVNQSSFPIKRFKLDGFKLDGFKLDGNGLPDEFLVQFQTHETRKKVTNITAIWNHDIGILGDQTVTPSLLVGLSSALSVFKTAPVLRSKEDLEKNGLYTLLVKSDGVINIGQMLYKWFVDSGIEDKIAVGIAGSMARVGGMCSAEFEQGRPISQKSGGQEEHVFSQMTIVSRGRSFENQREYYETCKKVWGLKNLDENATDTETQIGRNFTEAQAEDYVAAFGVKEKQWFSKVTNVGRKCSTVTDDPDAFWRGVPVTAAGPNTSSKLDASKKQIPTSGMNRTFDRVARENRDEFELRVLCTLIGFFSYCVREGLVHTLIPLFSTGIYAKGIQDQLKLTNEDIYGAYLYKILPTALQMEVGPNGEMLAQYLFPIVPLLGIDEKYLH